MYEYLRPIDLVGLKSGWAIGDSCFLNPEPHSRFWDKLILKGRCFPTTVFQIFHFFSQEKQGKAGKTGNIFPKLGNLTEGQNIWNASHSNTWIFLGGNVVKMWKYKKFRKKKFS